MATCLLIVRADEHACAQDEYVGLPEDHPESYHSFMWKHLFRHVDIKPENVHILDGNAKDLEAECMRVRSATTARAARRRLLTCTCARAQYEREISRAGGVELFLAGIGPDGHIAFNEPGSSLTSRTRVKTLVRVRIRAKCMCACVHAYSYARVCLSCCVRSCVSACVRECLFVCARACQSTMTAALSAPHDRRTTRWLPTRGSSRGMSPRRAPSPNTVHGTPTLTPCAHTGPQERPDGGRWHRDGCARGTSLHT